jgi:predicted enzyme related to lactoylglutathione lyase
MSKRDAYPAGVPCWVETLQPDAWAALGFYGPLLGWEFSEPSPMPGGLSGEYFLAHVEGHGVAGIGTLPELGGPPIAVWNTYVCVDDADAAVGRAINAGGGLLIGPVDAFEDGRFAVIVDPAGAAFSVWEARKRAGAQLVNEPGSWAMSSLHTPDPAGASAFYGAVFGWQSEAIASGEPVTLFRLSDYVGGNPGQPIPRDVVGVMTATGSDPAAPDVPPHWNVNLRVYNTDAVAAHAARLGGTVLMGPIDTPSLRSAVLLDPQGAAFSVSQLASGS